MLLDTRTIILSTAVTAVICLLVILALWRQSRDRLAGTGYWVLAHAVQALALLLIALRGRVPDWASMVLSNTLVVAGALLSYLGLERFLGKRTTSCSRSSHLFTATFRWSAPTWPRGRSSSPSG